MKMDRHARYEWARALERLSYSAGGELKFDVCYELFERTDGTYFVVAFINKDTSGKRWVYEQQGDKCHVDRVVRRHSPSYAYHMFLEELLFDESENDDREFFTWPEVDRDWLFGQGAEGVAFTSSPEFLGDSVPDYESRHTGYLNYLFASPQEQAAW